MGELRGPAQDVDSPKLEQKPALTLEATKHLPTLHAATFEGMDPALRLEFKRTRLDIKVLAREQNGTSTGKFDLFERLNTYGEPLSPQELRNCVLVSLNPHMFRWLKDLAADTHFRSCALLSEAQLLEKYDMDLALRFLTLRDAEPRQIGDVHEFLREEMEKIALNKDFDYIGEEERFRTVFKFFDENLNGNIFRPWNDRQKTFRGGFSLAAFEGLALSIGRHWQDIRRVKTRFDVEGLIKGLWGTPAYKGGFSGLRARERMVRVSPVAEQFVIDHLQRAKTVKPATRKKAAT